MKNEEDSVKKIDHELALYMECRDNAIDALKKARAESSWLMHHSSQFSDLGKNVHSATSAAIDTLRDNIDLNFPIFN